MSEFGKLLKERRLRKRLSQASVALRCGWIDKEKAKDSNTRIANYESGQRKPSILDLPVLARVLDIAAEDIMHALSVEVFSESTKLEGNSGGQSMSERERRWEGLDDVTVLAEIDRSMAYLSDVEIKRVIDFLVSKYRDDRG